MKTYKWSELQHKLGPEERETARREAIADYEASGLALAKARESTDAELADKLGMSTADVSALEELHLTTLAKHLRALGGSLEIRAVFPGTTFDLEPAYEVSQADAA